MNDTPCTKHVWSPALQVHHDLTQLMADNCWGFIPTCQHQEAPMAPLGDPPEMGKACGLNSPFWSNFSVFLIISELLGIRGTNLICWIIDCQGTCDLCYYCVWWLWTQTWIGSQEGPSLARHGKFEARWSSSFKNISEVKGYSDWNNNNFCFPLVMQALSGPD